MEQTQSFLQKYKKWIVILFLTIVACFFLFGSPKGWNRTKKYLDQFEVIEKQNLKKIQDSLDYDREYHLWYVDSIEGIKKVFIPNQNNELNRLRNENTKLQQKIDSIRFANYTQRQLDSFAKHAKHR